MTRHHPNLVSAPDLLCHVGNLIQPIRGTTQIWVVTRHWYGISLLVSQTSFGMETSGSVANVGCFFRLSHTYLWLSKTQLIAAVKFFLTAQCKDYQYSSYYHTLFQNHFLIHCTCQILLSYSIQLNLHYYANLYKPVTPYYMQVVTHQGPENYFSLL